MGWKKLVIFSTSIILNGCNIFLRNYYLHENGGYRPKNPKFELAKNISSIQQADLIDTNAIYILIDTLQYGKENFYKVQFYIRFFKHNRCFRSSYNISEYNELKKKGFHDFKNVGYYFSDNNNIIMENFYVKEKEKGIYLKKYGYIKNDSIFLYNHKYRSNEYPDPNKDNCEIYVRRKIESLTGAPDW